MYFKIELENIPLNIVSEKYQKVKSKLTNYFPLFKIVRKKKNFLYISYLCLQSWKKSGGIQLSYHFVSTAIVQSSPVVVFSRTMKPVLLFVK